MPNEQFNTPLGRITYNIVQIKSKREKKSTTGMNYKGMPNVSYHIAKYLATSFFPKVISEHTHTHNRPTALLGPQRGQWTVLGSQRKNKKKKI